MEDKYDLNDFISEYWSKSNEGLNFENIELEVELSSEVSSSLTISEKLYLSRIFGNLRSNALKAIWNVEQEEEYFENKEKFLDIKGKITVRTRKVNDVIELSISDNGHGIPKEHIDDVLKGTWSKRNKPVSRKIRGMHLIHDALNRLGGSIKLESEYGKGTTFYIYLPAIAGDYLNSAYRKL